MYVLSRWAVIGVNLRLLSGDKKNIAVNLLSKLGGSWVYTTQAMMTFTLIF